MSKRDDYSGRGMFGKETHAIVVDGWWDMQVAIEWALEDQPEDMEEYGITCRDDFRQDSMGLGMVYY